VSSVQTISGTGAVHTGARFLAKFYQRPKNQPVYLSNPTWANHKQIFENVQLPLADYPYYLPATRGLDFAGLIKALKSAPKGSIILLHPCAHNPTGVDPSREEWKVIAKVVREMQLFPFFDCAYQGFASGNLDNDAWAVRYFVEQGFELCIAQSFSKNLGLYGERAGCFHFVSPPSKGAQEEIQRIASQLAIVQRSEISNPPAYGARIADTVLNNPQLFAEWTENLQTMAGRIIAMREALVEKLKALETPGDWSHVVKQIGMFSFTGLNENQVQKLREEFHIYMTKNGRISMVGLHLLHCQDTMLSCTVQAGLNSHNIDYVAKAIDKTVREIPL
jgi:aspartate aminotransferase